MSARLSRWVGPAVVGFVAAVAAAYFVVEELRAWNVMFEDDFTNPDSGVASVDEGAKFRLRYVDGEYEILIRERSSGWTSSVFADVPARAVRIEVDVRLLRGSQTNDYYGVACGVGDDNGYVFGVYPDGYYFIARDPAGEKPWADLDYGQTDGIVKGGDDANHIRAECVGREGKPTLLRLFVNDREIGEARGSIDSFDAVWLLATSSSVVPAVTRFDNLVASEK